MAEDPAAQPPAGDTQQCGYAEQIRGPVAPVQSGAPGSLRLLDTCFGQGQRFFQTLQTWRAHTERSGLLHYVALTDCAPSLAELWGAHTDLALPSALMEQLAAQWYELRPGFHRISLDRGQIRLTLCIGPRDTLLREQQFEADRILLGAPPGIPASFLDPQAWDTWAAKALAKVCRAGTELWGMALSDASIKALSACGFSLVAGVDADAGEAIAVGEHRLGVFEPRWPIRRTRAPRRAAHLTPSHCVVVGAGIGGASVAAALAQRGWQVDVLDQADAPAAGASSLPAGLLVPHVSADDCLLSQLTRSGVRMTLQQAEQRLERGADWALSGVMGRAARLTQSSGSNRSAHPNASTTPAPPAPRWHDQAGWIKPAALAKAWLDHPGIRFRGNTRVVSIEHREGHWELRDDQQHLLARTQRVVLANALGAAALLRRLHNELPAHGHRPWDAPELRGMHGLVSWGFQDAAPHAVFPDFPINGAGSLLPGVALEGRPTWLLGAGYNDGDMALPSREQCHAGNLQRLAELVPGLDAALRPQFAAGQVRAWEQIRCTTPDRLPLVGPLLGSDATAGEDGLWLCTGLGSRGLSFSVLCAELLAALWSDEPLPLAFSQAQKLAADR